VLVIDYLKSQKNMTIILVEQCFNFVFTKSDNIISMTRSKVIYEDEKININKAKLRKAVSI